MSDQGGDRIRERAYRIWQEEGEPHGRHEEHWARAEQESQDDAPVADALASDQTASDASDQHNAEPAATAADTAEPVASSAPPKPKARRTTKKGAA